jgi:hypothetical protein
VTPTFSDTRREDGCDTGLSDFVGKSGSDDDCGKSGYSCRKNINEKGEEDKADKISILHTSYVILFTEML